MSAAADSSGEKSGALLLVEEREALQARLALAAHARERIDVQYYIWSGDAVGIAVIRELLLAALRGVHIRLLVDDIHFIAYDRRVLALDAYDNVEIRSFNPFRYRFRDAPLRSIAEIVSGASRLNHRMHNKVFSVDGEVAILGGRNLSNEYFGAHAEFNFRDIDVLVRGDAVDTINASFDEYWQSPWAIPIRELHKKRIRPLVVGDLQVGLSEVQQALTRRIQDLAVDEFFSEYEAKLIWCPIEVLADKPQKMHGREKYSSPVRERLFALTEQANNEILIENGYFIPGDEGLERLQAQVGRGVDIRVLTNSLASNDTGLSHAGYKRYRKRLLTYGVSLYEWRADAELGSDFELSAVATTAVGLHSKVATLDRRIGFVGSYNLDPRSAFINTEIGVMVHDAEFSEQLANVILDGMAGANSWRLGLSREGLLQWLGTENKHAEPKARFTKRWLTHLLSLLPVERQL